MITTQTVTSSSEFGRLVCVNSSGFDLFIRRFAVGFILYRTTQNPIRQDILQKHYIAIIGSFSLRMCCDEFSGFPMELHTTASHVRLVFESGNRGLGHYACRLAFVRSVNSGIRILPARRCLPRRQPQVSASDTLSSDSSSLNPSLKGWSHSGRELPPAIECAGTSLFGHRYDWRTL